MNSLGEEIQIEIKRNQQLKSEYDKLPDGVGLFGATMIQHDIDTAIKTLAEGDVIGMMQVYEKLKGNE